MYRFAVKFCRGFAEGFFRVLYWDEIHYLKCTSSRLITTTYKQSHLSADIGWHPVVSAFQYTVSALLRR